VHDVVLKIVDGFEDNDYQQEIKPDEFTSCLEEYEVFQ
jgi:hypothetical protein